MKERPKVIEILRRIEGEAADQALIDGLRSVEPEAQCDLVRIILDRESETALQGLPPLFHRLEPPAQALIVSNTARLFGALRTCVRSRNSETRRNALDIVRLNGNPRLAYLAGHAIHDGSPKIRAAAAVTLRALTDQHCRSYDETTTLLREAVESDGSLFQTASETLAILREERQYLLTTLREALDHYESHHHPEVLEAAMLLAPELEAGLFDQSTIKRGKLTHAMSEILTGSLSPRFAPFVYVAMAYPELRRRMALAIGACRDLDFFTEFIRWQWLARDPAVGKHLFAIRRIAWLNDGLQAAFSLPPDVAAMAPSWVLLLGLPADQKVALLMNFLIVDNPAANRAAAWALVDLGTPSSTLALQSLLDDEEPAIRRIADMELTHRARRGQHRHRQPDPSGRPETVLERLNRQGLTETFDDLWHKYEYLNPTLARAAGHHIVNGSTDFATQIQIKLFSRRGADRLRALRLILALFVCDRFKNEVFAIANDRSAEIRTVAMQALGQIGGETSRRILERALHDRAAAVQAAAIEGLDAMQAQRRDETVREKTESDVPEVRAAAVRCLLKMHVAEAAGEAALGRP
ncbi:MAG: hypothetical protein ACE5E1_11060 [Phycisphaerae bacterium]